MVIPERMVLTDEGFKNMKIDGEALDYLLALGAEWSVQPAEILALQMLLDDYSCTVDGLVKLEENELKSWLRFLYRYHEVEFVILVNAYSSLICDMENAVFPVPVSSNIGVGWISYEDSFEAARTYMPNGSVGTTRSHEGTDIFSDDNAPGVMPVLSMTDGTITQMGWLELGGYRIGITSDNGIYYYYAHLDSYADGLNVGDSVTAGQFLGFMGDTGYSRVVGTRGKFPVHLHIGIYLDVKGEEVAVNPYSWLKFTEDKVFIYDY